MTIGTESTTLEIYSNLVSCFLEYDKKPSMIKINFVLVSILILILGLIPTAYAHSHSYYYNWTYTSCKQDGLTGEGAHEPEIHVMEII
ncbi:MAG: hypothetical protein WAM14_17275 [Candidatus Nitrosopolaris sp.]